MATPPPVLVAGAVIGFQSLADHAVDLEKWAGGKQDLLEINTSLALALDHSPPVHVSVKRSGTKTGQHKHTDLSFAFPPNTIAFAMTLKSWISLRAHVHLENKSGTLKHDHGDRIKQLTVTCVPGTYLTCVSLMEYGSEVIDAVECAVCYRPCKTAPFDSLPLNLWNSRLVGAWIRSLEPSFSALAPHFDAVNGRMLIGLVRIAFVCSDFPLCCCRSTCRLRRRADQR
jgi:hypothetical protein